MENAPASVKIDEHRMRAEELKYLADNLFEQALEANSFWSILKQFKKNIKVYNAEMMCSPAFYSVIHDALATSLLLILSRFYDRDKKSISVNNLLNGIQEMTEDDLAPKVRENYELIGKRFQHRLKPIEECFYEKEVRDKKEVCLIIGCKYGGTSVDLSLEEYKKLYQKRYRELRKKGLIDYLVNLRNTIIAHNDQGINFNFDKVFDKSPLSNDDVEILLEFAIDCTQFFREMITGVYTVPEYVNSDDWEHTLRLVRLGEKYENLKPSHK